MTSNHDSFSPVATALLPLTSQPSKRSIPIVRAAGYRPCALFITIFIMLTMPTHAQHFPEELTFPRTTEEDTEEGEPGIMNFSTDQNLLDESFTSANNILYTPTFGPVSLEQSVWYELRYDKQSNTRHYLNTSGSLTHSLVNHAWFTPGIDWTPVTQYSSGRGGNNALATLDIGPTAALDAWGVPVLLRGGMSGRRVDSLAARFHLGGHRSNIGAYGAFRIGSPDTLLPFAPVYFFTDALGRSIENSAMASLSSSALGALQILEQDSVFLYGNFSLFNGREGYLEESADSRAMYFASTPWRIERGVEFTAGYKAARRYIFDPSIYYTVSENKLEFPDDARKRDELTLSQTLSGAVSTDSAAGVYYSGTLSFTWRNHDKLFGKEMAAAMTSDNLDSLDINLWDYNAFDPRTTHRLTVKLPLMLRLKYDFSLSRFLTEYPNFYLSGRDTVTNRDDSDRRTLAHRLALEYKNDSTRRAELFADFTGYDLVFLRSAKSSSNRTDNSQKVGLNIDYSPMNELLISEVIYAEAKRGSFRFPEFHQDALQRPRYSRAVNSLLSSVWQVSDMFGLSGKWNIKYSDYGYWYGREYMSEILAKDSAAKINYYAITSNSVYNMLDLSVRMNIGEAMLEAGNAFTNVRDRDYDSESGNYIISNENGFSTKPYFSAALNLWERVEMSAHISHTFVIGNGALGYWDFKLQAEGWF